MCAGAWVRTGHATKHMQMNHYRAITNDHCHTLGLHNTACHQYLLAEGCNINIYKADNTPTKPLMHVIANTEPYAENSSLYIQLLQPRHIRQLSSPVFQNCLVNRKLNQLPAQLFLQHST